MADPITIMAVGSMALSAGSAIYSGYSQKQEAKSQAGLMEDRARLAEEEAIQEAGRKSEERSKLLAQQKVAFLANGVGLQGSAQAVFMDTFNQFQQEIDAITRSGKATANYYDREAQTTKKSGRAQLISSTVGAAGQAMGNYSYGKKTGIF